MQPPGGGPLCSEYRPGPEERRAEMSLVIIPARNRRLKAVDSLIVGLTEKASTLQSLSGCSANKTECPRDHRVYLEKNLSAPPPHFSEHHHISPHTLPPKLTWQQIPLGAFLMGDGEKLQAHSQPQESY